MRNVLKTLASLTLAVAFVASRIPCWGPNYQPKAPMIARKRNKSV